MILTVFRVIAPWSCGISFYDCLSTTAVDIINGGEVVVAVFFSISGISSLVVIDSLPLIMSTEVVHESSGRNSAGQRFNNLKNYQHHSLSIQR